MKTPIITTILIALTLSSLYSTNLENIYGKNDLNLNGSRGDLYGNNFGSILDYDSQSPKHIDIEAAQSEIDQLRNEINIFAEEADRYEQQKAGDQKKKMEVRDLIDKMDLLLIKLKGTSADLYVAKLDQNDSAMRQKLQGSIEENREQIYSLTNRRNVLQNSMEDLSDRIIVSDRFITLNNLFIRKADSRIAYLESCIQYTGQDKTTVETLLEKSSSYQSEVDSLMNVSF